jgi:hypothetical protein
MDHSFHLPLLVDLKNPLNFLSRPVSFRKGAEIDGKVGSDVFLSFLAPRRHLHCGAVTSQHARRVKSNRILS